VITGHLGVAAAARSGWRGTSLLWLLAASIAPDILDVAYWLGGICNPNGLYSHTVPAAGLLAVVVGGMAYLTTGSRPTALAAALMVLAHLPLDLITGYKLYWPGGPLLGLRLYDHRFLDFLMELPLALGGWWLLRRSGSGAPRWAVGAAAGCALVVVQASFNAVERGLKPSACDVPFVALR
jgi:hypothetical protein